MPKPRTAFTLIELLIVLAILNVLLALFMPAVEMSRESARELQCKNNLKQLGLATEGYSSIYGNYPPGIEIKVPEQCPENRADCRGTGLFVTLLPYIEQGNWHTQYDAESPHGWLSWMAGNKELTEVEMPVYLCPSEGEYYKYKNRRHYYGISGGKRAYAVGYRGPAYEDGIYGLNRTTRHAQIIDGTSKTFAMGESDHVAWSGMGPGHDNAVGGPVPWFVGGACLANEARDDCTRKDHSYGRVLRPTKYEPNTSLLPMGPRLENDVPLGSRHPGITHFLYADGHVEVIADGIDLDIYQALSTYNGEELTQ